MINDKVIGLPAGTVALHPYSITWKMMYE